MATLPEKIAAVLPLARALLPANATALERALLAAELARLAEVDPNVVRAIWNPQLCPAPLLPFLAWANSVDVWDNDWPEAVKRDVIAAAPAVHRLKGTRASVERTLEAMRLRPSIKEWWQKALNGQRGTFAVTVYVNDHIFDPSLPVLSEQVQRNAYAAVRAAKPKSRTFSFALGVGFLDGIKLASRAAPILIDQRVNNAAPDLSRRNGLGLAGQAAGMVVDHRLNHAAPVLARRNGLGLAGRMAGLVVHRQQFATEGA